MLGIGLPTTANYLVVASLLAGVVVELGNAAGLALPLIAVHLFVFYFGLLADDTPPVCLAAFAASAISRADPLKTGVQAFAYDIRTAILPFVFIFNPELLLIGVDSFGHGIVIFVVSLLAILAFSSATQGWLFVRSRWYEIALLLVVTLALFRPDALMNQIYPEFSPIHIDRFSSGELQIENGRKIRLHVTRETDYGDRYKLFVFTLPEGRDTTAGQTLSSLDMVLTVETDGRWIVTDMVFNGLAEKSGIDFGDYVTAMDIEQIARPAKEWVYLPALIILLGVVLAQRRRMKRNSGSS